MCIILCIRIFMPTWYIITVMPKGCVYFFHYHLLALNQIASQRKKKKKKSLNQIQWRHCCPKVDHCNCLFPYKWWERFDSTSFLGSLFLNTPLQSFSEELDKLALPILDILTPKLDILTYRAGLTIFNYPFILFFFSSLFPPWILI